MDAPDYAPTIPEFLRTRRERFGDRTLIVLGERRLSYAEADRQSARLARGLLASGVSKGTRVGLLAPNGPDFAVGFLAAARIGAVVVPLNTFYKPRELGWVLHHADVHTPAHRRPRFLNNDYLERLETFAHRPWRNSKGRRPGGARASATCATVYVWGESDRTALPSWARPARVLEEAADAEPAAIDDGASWPSLESCVDAGGSDAGDLQLRQHHRLRRARSTATER